MHSYIKERAERERERETEREREREREREVAGEGRERKKTTYNAIKHIKHLRNEMIIIEETLKGNLKEGEAHTHRGVEGVGVGGMERKGDLDSGYI